MAFDYEKLYASTPDALGKPADWVQMFFDAYDGPRLRILDIGCGQGRDSLYAAAKGHDVLGIDLAPSGIQALEDAGKDLAGEVKGQVADLTTYTPKQPYDLLLINRTLHMLPSKEQTALIERLLSQPKKPTHILISDEPKNIPTIKQAVEQSLGKIAWQTATKNTLVT